MYDAIIARIQNIHTCAPHDNDSSNIFGYY